MHFDMFAALIGQQINLYTYCPDLYGQDSIKTETQRTREIQRKPGTSSKRQRDKETFFYFQRKRDRYRRGMENEIRNVVCRKTVKNEKEKGKGNAGERGDKGEGQKREEKRR